MDTISSILCVIVCTIGLPIGIAQIINLNKPFLFLILCLVQLLGYINSINYLYKKYNW